MSLVPLGFIRTIQNAAGLSNQNAGIVEAIPTKKPGFFNKVIGFLGGMSAPANSTEIEADFSDSNQEIDNTMNYVLLIFLLIALGGGTYFVLKKK